MKENNVETARTLEQLNGVEHSGAGVAGLPDIRECGNYRILSTVKDDRWMDWKIVECADGAYFRSDDIADGLTRRIAEAYALCSGFIKWDGCQQVYFPVESGNNVALHFDSDESISEFSAALLKVREIAAERLPTYEG